MLAYAETPEEFFRGETVTLAVGSGPGGGYDASDAFAATMKDGDFQAEATKLRLETRWFGPDKMKEVTSQMAATPAAVREKARQFSVVKKE